MQHEVPPFRGKPVTLSPQEHQIASFQSENYKARTAPPPAAYREDPLRP